MSIENGGVQKLESQWPLQGVEPESVGLSRERLGRIDELVQRYVAEGRIAGAVTVVSRRGGIAHLSTCGLMDIEQRKAMRTDAIFRIYSMTKLVTSVALLMLMEEGHFLLSDPVSKFIPEFGNIRVKVTGADGRDELVRPRRPVTIHDLLTHTSGISYEYEQSVRGSGITLAEFAAAQCQRPLCFQPGERWMYGASTDVAGRVVEVVSGLPLDEFFRRRIFEPLGMTDTDFHVPPEKVDRFAWVYKPNVEGRLVDDEDRVTSRFLSKPAFFSGGGGLVGTTSDYLRFSLALLGGGRFGDVRLLGRKTVELMTADHLPPGHPPVDVNQRGFGLGVSVLRRLGETRQLGSAGEFGWGGAACTQVWIDPAEEMVSMIMMQLRPLEKFTLMDLFKQAAYQALVE